MFKSAKSTSPSPSVSPGTATGSAIPELYGKYVFGNFTGPEGQRQGRLFYGDLLTRKVFEFKLDATGLGVPPSLYSIGEDLSGELYALGSSADGSKGLILRLAAGGLVGDTNGDGKVDLTDLNNVRNHFGAVGTGLVGDAYPSDGVVDLKDLNAVRNQFGQSRFSNAASVPEPASFVAALEALALLVIGSRLAARRKWR